MKLNKIITGLCAFAILSLFFSCASKKASGKKAAANPAETAVEESLDAEEEELAQAESETAAEAEEAEDSEKAAETAGPVNKIQKDEPVNTKEAKKNYTGWVSSSIRPITSTIGDIKINVRPKRGTFSLSVLNEDGKAIPVLSTANEYTTTSLYLKAGKKLLKLCDDSNVSSAAKKTAKGVSIRYTIEKSAIVQLDFDCLASAEGKTEDTIKVTATVHSLAKKKTDFALKFLLDTVLGETDRHHFYTSQDKPVKGEVLYHSMEDEKWITSRNAKASMQFIFAGADISPVESVALANFTTLDTKKWEADMTTFRSFDTVLSYNNSALAVYWPKVTLETDQEASQVFYLSLATGNDIPGGAAYIEALTQAQNPQTEEEVSEETEAQQETSDVKEEKPVENIQAVEEESQSAQKTPASQKTQVQTPVEEPKPKETKTPETPKTEPQNVPAVEEKTPPKTSAITNEKLSLEYIQKLLDKIENLQAGDPDANKEEINALNAELDAILTILNAN